MRPGGNRSPLSRSTTHTSTPGSGRPTVPGRFAVGVLTDTTGEPVAQGKMGMLLVSGPTVFPGYIGYDGPSPFRERDGKRWYVTGDLVNVSPTISGRLSELLVDEGARVQKGQLLARMTDNVQQAEIRAAQAALDTARSQVPQGEQ